jgi:hypothetical protein
MRNMVEGAIVFVDSGLSCFWLDCYAGVPTTHPRFHQGKPLEPRFNIIFSTWGRNDVTLAKL